MIKLYMDSVNKQRYYSLQSMVPLNGEGSSMGSNSSSNDNSENNSDDIVVDTSENDECESV